MRIHSADTDGISFEESLSDKTESRPDAFAERASLIETLGRAVSELDEHSTEILTLRYGLDGTVSRTLEETGEDFGVTRERVRQIESKALRKHAHPSRSKSLAHFLYADPPVPEPSTDEGERVSQCQAEGASKKESRTRKASARQTKKRQECSCKKLNSFRISRMQALTMKQSRP